jgi:arylsulfatase A-like enzyme
MVDHLNDAGYETAHFGFQHERLDATKNRYRIEGNLYDDDDWINREGEWCDCAISRGIGYLEANRKSKQPFYLNIGTMEVHASRWSPSESIPANSRHHRGQIYGKFDPNDVDLPNNWPEIPSCRDTMARFHGSIEWLDHWFGQLMAAIDRLGYREDTIIIFTTDHGIHGPRSKTTLYDRGVEIACLISLPHKAHAGLVVDHLMQNIDLAPTVLESAGVDVPAEMNGKSFWPLLNGTDYTPHDAIVVERNYHALDYDPIRALRTKDFHYIRNFDTTTRRQCKPYEITNLKQLSQEDLDYTEAKPILFKEPEELYSIDHDVDEFHNLAKDKSHAKIKKYLSEYLDQWMIDFKDPLLDGVIAIPSDDLVR